MRNKFVKNNLGFIPPDDWTISKIGDFSEVKVGRDLKEDRYNESKSEDYKYPVYSNTVENYGLYGFYSKPEYSEKCVTVVGRGAGVGTAFKRDEPFGAIGRLLVLIPNGKVNSEYLKLFINDRVRFYNESTGVPQLTGVQVKTYLIAYPSNQEQIDISNIITNWDEAISKTEKLIQAKKRYKKGLMQRLLSGKVRFPEFVKSEELRKTRFGIYPKDWEYVKIQEIATQVKNKVGDETEGYTVMSCTKHDGLVSSLEYFDRQVFSKDISNYKAVEKGEFAYATNHVEEGSIGYNNWCEKGAISPMYTVFKADQDKIDNDYLYAIIKTENYRRIFEIFTNGTVNRRGSLRWKDFKKIKVPVPALEEQKAISTVLKKAEQEIQLLEAQLEKYQLQKKGLMQQLLTGKVRVN